MAVYTFIQDNSTIDVDKVKKFCRIDNDDWDDILQIILDAVKGQADAYCQSNFTEYQTVTDGTVVPRQIELWILKACLAVYKRPNILEIRNDIQDEGAEYFRFDWDQYIEDLKPYRREPGF